jgi:hypothetical protein
MQADLDQFIKLGIVETVVIPFDRIKFGLELTESIPTTWLRHCSKLALDILVKECRKRRVTVLLLGFL